MAIGTVVSNRNFGSFLGSGKVYQTEKATAHQRGECSGFAAAHYVYRNLLYRKLSVLRESSPSSRYSHCLSLRVNGPSNFKTLIPMATFWDEGEHLLSMSRGLIEKFQSINPRRRIGGICKCCLSSTPSGSHWVQPRKLDKLGISDKQRRWSRHFKKNWIRADYKSDEYDITGMKADSFASAEGSSEFALVDGVQEIKPWWEQFPKRWVIVLLCFSAFLLCNMDRVNMSIAILPMSQEFNWNSATVGLIQSSFFWGYLLTQIVGGSMGR
ncbi:hypothetical protein F0562_014900 [Nyssa sinensis]|uniref:Major facilitator superfamily (MFS) profile domain-containing protein n=1 Tax=Nyssa sinensis TaxID=561372 RepID=A0A5J4ZS38_9ASTE|nr:hypothetical protein F0562_014900 [Nyssa sinensis]